MSFSDRLRKSLLEQGAVIAYPTETVWGLGCLPDHERALQHLANIKQRSTKKGFILVSPTIEFCLPYIDPQFHTLAKQHIILNKEQPTTWLVPKSAITSPLISGQYSTVAIRISPHTFINKMCRHLRSPLTSTSANLHGRPSLNSALQIERNLGNKVHHVVYGFEGGSGKASTIIDLQSLKVIRH